MDSNDHSIFRTINTTPTCEAARKSSPTKFPGHFFRVYEKSEGAARKSKSSYSDAKILKCNICKNIQFGNIHQLEKHIKSTILLPLITTG